MSGPQFDPRMFSNTDAANSWLAATFTIGLITAQNNLQMTHAQAYSQMSQFYPVTCVNLGVNPANCQASVSTALSLMCEQLEGFSGCPAGAVRAPESPASPGILASPFFWAGIGLLIGAIGAAMLIAIFYLLCLKRKKPMSPPGPQKEQKEPQGPVPQVQAPPPPGPKASKHMPPPPPPVSKFAAPMAPSPAPQAPPTPSPAPAKTPEPAPPSDHFNSRSLAPPGLTPLQSPGPAASPAANYDRRDNLGLTRNEENFMY